MRFRVERICRSDSMSVIPLDKVRFDLSRSCRSLKANGYDVERHELYLIVKSGSLEMTVYGSGRVLFHPLNDKERAKELAQELYAWMVPE